MKYSILLVLLLCSLTSFSQMWTFEQGVRTGKMYCVKGGQEIGQQHERYWRKNGQVAYADGIHFAIETCSLQGKFQKESKRVNPVCNSFLKNINPRLYKFVGCETIDKSKILSQ